MTKKKSSNTTQDVNINRLNSLFKKVLLNFKPPEDIKVSEWSDKHRILSGNAEPGPWRTSRTPYLKEPMDAFCDYKIHRIVTVAPSQVGKSEIELNILGYIIDNSPATTMFLQPTVDNAKKFSKLRIASLINDCKTIKKKVHSAKSRDSGNTILQKSFPGGTLILIGTNAPGDLASTPAKYVIGDERDRHAKSAGSEGDPWELVAARQTTFRDYKSVEVSSPTTKGASNIVDSFEEGTQEYWCHQCPECGEWHNITFTDIRFEYEEREAKKGKKQYSISFVGWACSSCGCITPEKKMRKQPQKWIANNPEAYKDGIRSFWINGFVHPWRSWTDIVKKFLSVRHDPEKLKVFKNTVLGELWEERNDIDDEDTMLARREVYEAELPDGVLVLTCGVDTQDDRLEFEVLGHGKFDETWGIKKGVIIGKPDNEATWFQLDEIIDRVYKFKNERGLKVAITLVDSGGHYTQEVYKACYKRQSKRVFAIKGKGGDGIPFVCPPKKVAIKDNKRIACWLYSLGVDSGKASIMSSLKVQESGPKYCHFPSNEGSGYDFNYFNGLMSETLVLSKTKSSNRWTWEKIPGHQRNEPLDIRNYAKAGFKILDPDLDAVEKRLKTKENESKTTQKVIKKAAIRHKNKSNYYDEW